MHDQQKAGRRSFLNDTRLNVAFGHLSKQYNYAERADDELWEHPSPPPTLYSSAASAINDEPHDDATTTTWEKGANGLISSRSTHTLPLPATVSHVALPLHPTASASSAIHTGALTPTPLVRLASPHAGSPSPPDDRRTSGVHLTRASSRLPPNATPTSPLASASALAPHVDEQPPEDLRGTLFKQLDRVASKLLLRSSVQERELLARAAASEPVALADEDAGLVLHVSRHESESHECCAAHELEAPLSPLAQLAGAPAVAPTAQNPLHSQTGTSPETLEQSAQTQETAPGCELENNSLRPV